MVHTVPSVLQRVNIWILLSSELPHHVVWHTATITGNPDVSILRPENGGTRFLEMFVTIYQSTCCDNQKTTVFTINRCKTLSFLGWLRKSSVSETICHHHYDIMWRLTRLAVVLIGLAWSWSFPRICPNLKTCVTFCNTLTFSWWIIYPSPNPQNGCRWLSGYG